MLLISSKLVSGVTITLDESNPLPVSSYIYGVNFANSSQLSRNKYTVNR